MPIGEPQQWSFIPQGFEEYLPFRSEEAATEYATRLAQELAQRWGLVMVETTYQGQRAWRLGPAGSRGDGVMGSGGAEVQGR